MIWQFLSTILQNRAFENKICLSWIQHFYPIVPLTYYSKCSKKRQRFAPGQSEAVVRVPILKDSAWHTCEDCPLACQSLGVSIRGPSMPPSTHQAHRISQHHVTCNYLLIHLCIYTHAVPLYISSHSEFVMSIKGLPEWCWCRCLTWQTHAGVCRQAKWSRGLYHSRRGLQSEDHW